MVVLQYFDGNYFAEGWDGCVRYVKWPIAIKQETSVGRPNGNAEMRCLQLLNHVQWESITARRKKYPLEEERSGKGKLVEI
ncbi:unnamed protein product [Brugia timori]|uniref:Transposase_23 domain-containing protein n=1 Tax=Brugia timori TaxID=42155 RepID=A0A0R3QH73_9BILA|nr:unnamed protein product [Brugia timori]